MPEIEAKKVFRGVLNALAYCHSVGVSHGDLKAENILLRDSCEPVIIDFGFSMHGDSKVSLFRGTITYMAPEITLRKPYLGKCADVWALGVLLYFMLYGVTPFRGCSDTEIRGRIERGVYSVPKYVSSAASAFLAKILVVDPESRATCQDLLNESWIQEADRPKKSSFINI